MSFVHTKDEVELALNKATELGLIRISQREIFNQTIQNIVTHTELKDFFESDGKVINEQTIIKKNTKSIKPDRVVIKDNMAYLLDYKTGEKHHKHITQLEEYELALREMNYSVAKKALIYIGESIEIVTL
jgi:CRISPR/Cas system-associated exonuclease Cas4 (RecB family)